jgi:hypothetical protein
MLKFGVKKKNTFILPYIQKRRNSNFNSKLGAYLAGLIEGDGHIAVLATRDKNSKSKKFSALLL